MNKQYMPIINLEGISLLGGGGRGEGGLERVQTRGCV